MSRWIYQAIVNALQCRKQKISKRNNRVDGPKTCRQGANEIICAKSKLKGERIPIHAFVIITCIAFFAQLAARLNFSMHHSKRDSSMDN